jgi:hypothetical protein
VLRQKKRLVRRAPDAIGKLLSIMDNPRYFDLSDNNKNEIGYSACHTLLSLCYVLDKDVNGAYVSEIRGKAIDLIVKKMMHKRRQ